MTFDNVGRQCRLPGHYNNNNNKQPFRTRQLTENTTKVRQQHKKRNVSKSETDPDHEADGGNAFHEKGAV